MIRITNLNDFRSAVSAKEEIREAYIGEGCTSFCYMISSQSTFDSLEARECRGIVFNSTLGTVVGRPLHKFFNLNEREETQTQKLDWSKVARVMDKRDGSMIHSVWTMNGPQLKSKKSFNSEVAVAAEKWMHAQPNLNVLKLIMRMQSINKTVIMEWTAPDARIVIFYPESKLTVLHIRDNVTGEYTCSQDLRVWCKEFGVDLVEEVDLSALVPNYSGLNAKTFQYLHENIEGVEGWVIQFDDGNMIKLKTKYYLDRHHAMTFVRERDIAQLALDEGLDDMKGMLVGDGIDITRILEIEQDVVSVFVGIENEVERLYNECKDMVRKDIAMKYTGHQYFSLLMKRVSGSNAPYKDYFERHILKERYGLTQVVMTPSKAEVD